MKQIYYTHNSVPSTSILIGYIEVIIPVSPIKNTEFDYLHYLRIYRNWYGTLCRFYCPFAFVLKVNKYKN